MDWIYLSPHFDDAALSCGGLIWEQDQAGDTVSVWTVCAAAPAGQELSPFAQSLHQRWQAPEEAASRRRLEDQESVRILGASYRYFDLPDCIYRTDSNGHFLYDSEESLFSPLHPAEESLVMDLAGWLAEAAGQSLAKVVCPLALGGHVDHRLTRAAVERWQQADPSQVVVYYPDYPYVLNQQADLRHLKDQGWQEKKFQVSEAGLQAWVESVAAHASQISTFWPSLSAMKVALRSYLEHQQGGHLYLPPEIYL